MKAKTVFLDLDGCVFKHCDKGACHQWSTHVLLPSVVDAFNEWERKGYCVVLVTARKESCRPRLEWQLRNLGLFWDALIMGAPSGQRVLVNDQKADTTEPPSAVAVVLKRNEGLKEVVNL